MDHVAIADEAETATSVATTASEHISAPTEQIGAAQTSTLESLPLSSESSSDEYVSGSTTVTIALAELESCVQVAARGAAERLLRLELVSTEANDTRHDWVRMTTYDPAGWWEFQDISVAADRPVAQTTVVVVRELGKHSRICSASTIGRTRRSSSTAT